MKEIIHKRKQIVAVAVTLLLMGLVCSCSASNIEDTGQWPMGNYSTIHVVCSPQQYVTAMSSTPGIQIAPSYGQAEKFRYTSDFGRLFTWENSIISDDANPLELPPDTSVYWSPGGGNISAEIRVFLVIIEALDKDGNIIARQGVEIEKRGDTYSPNCK